jgi:hypothetical protein
MEDFTLLQRIVYAIVYAACMAWNDALKHRKDGELNVPGDEDTKAAGAFKHAVADELSGQKGGNPRP